MIRLSGFLIAVLGAPLLASAASFDAATATNQVGLDLFRELTKTRATENLVISPYSIESALALAYIGADGETRTEMAQALHFPASEKSFEKALSNLQSKLDEVDFKSANRLFVQKGYPLREEYLSRAKETLDATPEAMDFAVNPAKAAETINAWVEKQTEGKISDIVQPANFSERTRMVLVNALYLKAAWNDPFERNNTTAHPFHVQGGTATRQRTTMQSTLARGYAKEDGLTIVALDYQDGDLQCLILLPAHGRTLQDVVAKLTPRHFADWATLNKRRRPLIDLRLPKFQAEGKTLPLTDALKALGMRNAFDEPRQSANFDGISPRTLDGYLALSAVSHKTFVALDEESTEAAAATSTAIMLTPLSAGTKRPKVIPVHVDRPFLFAIQHRATGICLFLGQINDPR